MTSEKEALPDMLPVSERAMIEPRPELVRQAYAAILEGELPPEVGDPAVTARAIQERFTKAETAAEVLRPSKLRAWSELGDVPVTLLNFHLNPSGFEQGSAVYAVCEIMHRDSGEIEPVSVGGGNVLVQLVKLWELGALPVNVRMLSKPTQQGFTTLYLEAA